MKRVIVTVHCLIFAASSVFAAGSGMPWESPLQQFLDSITGPTLRVIAVIIIIATGLSLGFGEVGHGFRKLLQVILGLSVAFTAASFFLSFLGFGGGVSF